MPSIVVSNLGEAFLLQRLLGRELYDPLEPYRARLFTNNYTPTRDVELADVTEAAFPGYAPIDLYAPDWTDPIDVNGAAVSWYTMAPVVWQALSGSTWCYGYYVTDWANAVLLWAARFDAPQLANGTTPVVATLGFSSRSVNEPV
jgi:hypothetical protein